ncbi:MAG: outer membrane protein assembly factor BamA [Candidatus Omnitrophica bacterium]|nr:outer membrane protein assembly factor BamA [Candidatus Omnitrophota bacterium]
MKHSGSWVKLFAAGTALAMAFCFWPGRNAVLRAEEPAQEQASGEQAEKAAPAEQAQTPPVITKIEIRGNQIVNTNTILNKLRAKEGSELVQETINDDIKRLYGTGFFQDIKVEVVPEDQGFRLLVVVEEKPIVRQILIEGAKVFSIEKLRKEVNLVEGQILDPKVINEGVNKIKAKYLNKGFKFAEVRTETDVNEETKEATVYIIINEGVKYTIKEVRLQGVKSLKHRAVKKKIKTKKKWFYRSGVYKEEKFKEDLDRVRAYYQENGFLDVRVSPEFVYDEKDQKMVIVVYVEEGNRYSTGEVQIQGNLLFPQSEIWQNLAMLPGTVYSQKGLVDDVEAIRKYYFERGYIDARILPETKLNQDTGKVDVVYQITEGDLYFVDKVKIRGNTKTKDIVIRRELRIRPGERFDGAKLERSKERLTNLGYFEEVVYDSEPGSEPNRRDVIFRVKEKQTGELSFGAGISSIEQFVGFAEIAQRNFDLLNWPRFTGGGQSISLKGRMGSLSRDFDFSFVEPYLFNKPVSLGLDLFSVTRFKNNVDFDEKRLGGTITLSKGFTEFVRSGFGYTMEQVTLEDISSDASSQVTQFAGDTLLSRLKWFISRDSRNNVFNPTRGSVLSFSSELIGSVLGGDEDFYIVQTSGSKYFTFAKKHTFETKLRLGAADSYSGSNTVPVFDRFYAGGLGTVRGYNARRVGPKEGGDAVGGQTLMIANVEYTFPIITNFKGALFVDAGQVNAESYKIGFGDFAVSIGPGFKVNTPIGPMNLYYGYPFVNPDDKNKNGRFEFSFSRGF